MLHEHCRVNANALPVQWNKCRRRTRVPKFEECLGNTRAALTRSAFPWTSARSLLSVTFAAPSLQTNSARLKAAVSTRHPIDGHFNRIDAPNRSECILERLLIYMCP